MQNRWPKKQERKRKEAERAAAKAKEAINIKTDFCNQLNRLFNDYLLNKKQKFQQKFNELTLEKFADDAAAIRQYVPNFSEEHFIKMVTAIVNPSAVYHSANDMITLLKDATGDKHSSLSEMYVNEMTALKTDIADKLKSKHEELKEQKRIADEVAAQKEQARIAEEKRQEEIKNANAAKKKQLEEEARIAREQEAKRQEELRKQQEAAEFERKQREQEDNERMAREAEAARVKADQEAEIKRQGEQTMVLFEQEAAMAETTNAPEVRQGYEIEILHPVACTQIFALWFENEGKNLPVDKILNTKIDQMKTWAEKHAHKNNVRIESKFLNYKESFKAVNRKAK
jgi:hypothetical protein